jgi:hypothetical protein
MRSSQPPCAPRCVGTKVLGTRVAPRAVRLALAMALALAAALPVVVLAQAPVTQPKLRIEKAADLPRFSYPVNGSLEALVRSPEAFAPLAAALRRNTESVLAAYEIPDKGTRRDLISLLAVLDFLDGQYARSLARAEEVRSLQDKPADRLLSGLRLRAMASAAQAHAAGSEAYRQAVVDTLRRELAAMPFPVVENEIKQAKAGAEMMGESLLLGPLREVLQPMASSAGALSSEFAPALVNVRFGLVAVLPMKATFTDVFAGYLAQHKTEKSDIWAARDAVLPASGPYAKVALAVWDSGVDTSLFPGQLLRDADGTPALIAFDKYAMPAQGMLHPIPAELQAKLPQLAARTKGLSDLQSNIDSAEATQVKLLLSTLAPEQFKAVVEEIGLAGNYQHGSHVAGIVMAGNPHAQLAVARIEFSHTLQPDPCPSLALARRDVPTRRPRSTTSSGWAYGWST